MAKEFGELRVLKQLNKYEFAVSLRIMRSGLNRNRWDYQNIDQYYETFAGQPILCAFPNGRIGDGHLMETKVDEDGEIYASFIGATSERIVGTISEDKADLRLVEEEGETWLEASGRLFSFYAKELVDYIVKKGVMEVSAETEVYESYEENGIEVFTSWCGLGVTLLGEGVAPAIPGANVKALKEITGEFEQLKLRAASYIDGSDEGEEDEGENPEDEPNTKPQHINSKRRVGMKALSMTQLALLSNKFEGYSVLAGGTDDAGITHICLMSKDGSPAMYETDNINDSVIVPEKILRVDAQVCYEVGEETIKCDSSVFVDRLSAEVTTLNNQLTTANSTIESLTGELDTMKANEQARRITAAKAKAVDTLNRFNANRELKVSEDILTKINEDIDNKEYSDCLNGDGEWVGEAKVEEAVLAACAVKVMEMDKISAEKNNSQYIWSDMEGRSADADGIDGLLASFGIQ